MLRRTGFFLTLFSSSGGSAPRSNQSSSGTGTDASVAEAGTAGAGVYLPWTSRPWAVTYRVHYAQWKFVDTVFAHLATVSPAVLNDRAQQQGVRDVLCELEEPVVALRRQQARQARQLKKQEKSLAAVATAFQGTTIIAATPPSDAALREVTTKDASPATYEAVDRQAALPDNMTKMKVSRKNRKGKVSRKSRKVVEKAAASSVVIYEL